VANLPNPPPGPPDGPKNNNKNNSPEGDEPTTDAETVAGAAVFPLIPEELGIDPLLLGLLHAYVFLEGSEEPVVHPLAAEEAMQYLATYLQRLQGPRLKRVQEDLLTLAQFAKMDQWPKVQIRFLQTFLADNGVVVPPAGPVTADDAPAD